MNLSEFRDISDSSDEDYIPNTKNENNVSEESGGESEDDIESEVFDSESKKRTKRGSFKTNFRKKRKPVENENNSLAKEDFKILDDEKKKVEDDVWADFMRDTGFQSRKDRSANSSTNNSNVNASRSYAGSKSSDEKSEEKVKITQVFNFAGEEVTVEKEVPKVSTTSVTNSSQDSKNFKSKSNLSGILNQLGKKPKISTLEKSKLDWDQFKKEENLEEELQTHNKGKDGYLEKQDFLQRADLRRFAIEKEIRTIERSKRMSNL